MSAGGATEIVERYIILLLGSADGPIPTAIHVQKELFALAKANPRMEEYLSFEKHNFGPYSTEVDESAQHPIFHPDAYRFKDRYGLELTDEGRRTYDALVKEHSTNPKFKELLAMMRMVRRLYDSLTTEELLLLIYATYGEFTERSQVSDSLLASAKRRRLAVGLLRKGAITRERYDELVGME
jgi:hypothetical protein